MKKTGFVVMRPATSKTERKPHLVLLDDKGEIFKFGNGMEIGRAHV